MNPTATKYLTPIKEKWDKFSPRQRRNIAVAVVCGIVCVAVVSWVTTRPNYVTVMSGLDNNSLGQVQQQLDTLKIPNEINGSSVLVPKADADQARIQLSMAGLPKSGAIDYSSIKSSYGMTQDQFNLQVLNVLQKELEQTINNMNGVIASQVNIVMPQQSNMFVNNNQPSKASVFLQIGNGAQVTPAEVAGIQSLVAHSVNGLMASDVSVVDQNGNTLSAQADTSATGGALTTSELNMRQQVENQLQQQLEAGLSRIVGSGHVVVTVNANVSFNETKTQTHSVSSAKGQSTGLPSNQQVTKSSSTSSGTGSGGLVGQTSTNPNSTGSYPGVTGSSTNSTSTQSETTTNYDNNYVNTQTTSDPIQINGYSVGVLVDSNDKSITSAVLTQIKAYVQNTVGNQSGQKNSVTVSAVPFQKPTVQFIAPKQHNYVTLAAGGGGLLLLLLGGIWLFMAQRRKKRAEELAAAQRARDIGNNDPLTIGQDYNKRKVSELVENNPQQFVSMLRNWMNED